MAGRSRFDRSLTVPRAVKDLEAEVGRWNGTDLAVVPDSLQGRNLVQKSADTKPGCIISFTTEGGRKFVRHANHYDRLQCNIRAFVKTLENLRANDRYGLITPEASLASLMLDVASTDQLMLPAGPTMPTTKAEAYKVIGVKAGADADTIKASYRSKAKVLHPDRMHGDGTPMAVLNAAKALLGAD